MHSILFAALALVLVLASPVAAQSSPMGRPLEPAVPSWSAPVEAGHADAPQAMSGMDPTMPDAPARPIPVDGGLGLLAAAGAAYAARRFRSRGAR